MPIYEFRCNECQQVFEEWTQSHSIETYKCPVCGNDAPKIVSNTSFILKGGGWYATDYGNRSQKVAETSSSSQAATATEAASGTNTTAPGAPAPSNTSSTSGATTASAASSPTPVASKKDSAPSPATSSAS